MDYSPARSTTATTGKTALAIVATLSLLLSLFALAAPVAADHSGFDHQPLPIDTSTFAQDDEACKDVTLEPGQVLLHWIANQQNVAEPITVTLSLEGGGSLVEDSYKWNEPANIDANVTHHFEFIVDGDITVSDLDISTGEGNVRLSHVCRGAGEEEMVEVSIMKHLCTDVANVDEFEAIEAAAAEENPDNAFAPLVATVLACPTIVFTGDVPTEGAISAGDMDYEFSVVDANGTQLLSEDGNFMQAALCESAVGLDLDGDPAVDACLDISHYTFEVVDGLVVITETEEPDGHHLGTIRFTPGSDDADTLVGSIATVEATGVITIDTTKDGDDEVMIHAYNFVNEGTEGGNNGRDEGTLGGNPVPDTALDFGTTGTVPAATSPCSCSAGWAPRLTR